MISIFRKRKTPSADAPEKAERNPVLVRIVPWVCVALAVLALASGGAMFWHRTHTFEARLAALSCDVHDILVEAYDAGESADAVLEKGAKKVSKWRRSIRKSVPFEPDPSDPSGTAKRYAGTLEQAVMLDRLYELDDERIPGWRKTLESEDLSGKPDGRKLADVRAELLVERDKWPRKALTKEERTVRESAEGFANGALGGAIWPYRLAVRVRKLFFGPAASSGPVVRRLLKAVFPWTLRTVTFPWVLGFCVASMAIGFLLCWAGAKLDSAFLGEAGLLYFFYDAVFLLCTFLLLFGIL